MTIHDVLQGVNLIVGIGCIFTGRARGEGVMLLLVLLLLWPVQAFAIDPYIEAGLGASSFQRTTPDGTWVQEGMGFHKFHNQDLAFRAGVGVKLNEAWAIGANYVNLGTVKVETMMVQDADYDIPTKTCTANCANKQYGRAMDRLDGGELIATYTYRRWMVEPYLGFGGALMRHSFSWNTETPGQPFTNYTQRGIVLMGVGRVGACVKWLCADVSYYKGMGSTWYPVSDDALVTMAVVKVPL